MSDEQRVRTMAGWIGVEISRSRVRTPGKAGYGMYRVRGERRTAAGWEKSPWTAYALGLGAVESAAEASIHNGAPSGPGSFITGAGVVPTRWTSAYRGRRDLGGLAELFGLAGCGCPNRLGGEPPLLHACPRCGFQGGDNVHTECLGCEYLGRSTVRSRQRGDNAQFQKEHLERRAHGLVARYAQKARRNRGE